MACRASASCVRPRWHIFASVCGVHSLHLLVTTFPGSVTGCAVMRCALSQVPKHVTEVDLRPLFEPYGEIMCLNVLRTQRGQGPSAGCAFVEVHCCVLLYACIHAVLCEAVRGIG